jgi:hypothetical protein
MTCPACTDPDTGEPLLPVYGVAPHTCFYKIPGATMGQSVVLPRDQWPANFHEDPENPGCGIWSCEHCGEGLPCAEPS